MVAQKIIGHKKIHLQMNSTKNIVPRGDYTRVLAEFWADGSILKHHLDTGLKY